MLVARDRPAWWRWLVPAALAWITLLGFHWYMDTYAGWGISRNAASNFSTGSWLAIWWKNNPSIAHKALMIFAPFGFAWLFAALGYRHARTAVRQLAIGAVLPMLMLVYVQTPGARARQRVLRRSSRSPPCSSAQVPPAAAWAAAITSGLVTARMGLSTELLPSSSVLLIPATLAAAWAVAAYRAQDAIRFRSDMTKTSGAQFNWSDPLLLDQQLTHDERMVARRRARLRQERLAPRVLEAFRHEKTDPSIFREMGELGLLGVVIPEQYGGAGMNYVSYGLVAREVERVDSGYRSMMSVQCSLVMVPINEFGTEAQKQKYLPKLATGEWIGCFGLTEPNHGSDPGSMITRAKKVDGGYSLTGTKMWITNSPIADVFVVWAKDDEGEIRGFVLEKGVKGLSAPPIHGKVGLRTSITGEIVMDDVFCPEENAFPEVRGLKGPFTCLNSARYGIGWGALGAAEDCWHPRPPVRAGPQAVRPAAGRQPADPEEARRHADRDRARPAGLPAARPHEGRRHGRRRRSPRS